MLRSLHYFLYIFQKPVIIPGKGWGRRWYCHYKDILQVTKVSRISKPVLNIYFFLSEDSSTNFIEHDWFTSLL